MKENYTHIAILVDRSGSMSSIRKDMEGGIENFLKEQKEIDGECTVSLAYFDNIYSVEFGIKPIREVNEIAIEPRGMTALLDSMCRFIKDVGSTLNELAEDEKPDRVLFITITDGEENASIEYTNEMLKDMIKEQEEKYKWNFTYIGANQDSFDTSSRFGGRMDNSLNYTATGDGILKMSSTLSDATKRYRSKNTNDINFASFNYTEDELNS